MDVAENVELPCDRRRAHAELADLAGYPAWIGIVRRATPAGADEGDGGPAWDVEMGAAVGPFRRSKRLRMVRTADRPGLVRFERREVDGRSHAVWVLEVTLVEKPGRRGVTFTTVKLHYGGAAWVPLLDVVLAAEVRRAGPRLRARVRT